MFFISISFQAYSDYGAVVSGVTPDGSAVLVSFGVSDTSVVVSGVLLRSLKIKRALSELQIS